MSSRHDRLRRARIEAGFERAADAIKRFGWPAPAYKGNENGNATFSYDTAKKYAQAYGVVPAWLYDDDYVGPMKPQKPGEQNLTPKPVHFPITGKVAAGIEGYYEASFSGEAEDYVIFDPDEITMVLEIAGDSGLPRFRPGDKVFFGYRYDDPSQLVGQAVMVQTREDERKLFKILRRGSRPGKWDLYSINPAYDPIRDVEVDWALPVKWVRV